MVRKDTCLNGRGEHELQSIIKSIIRKSLGAAIDRDQEPMLSSSFYLYRYMQRLENYYSTIFQKDYERLIISENKIARNSTLCSAAGTAYGTDMGHPHSTPLCTTECVNGAP
jgi:hypothetical protein